MRFRLTLELTDLSRNILPLNYQYELSAWIYKVLHFGNPQFATWLHNQGFTNDRKQFRLFTFSNLLIRKLRTSQDRLIIQSDHVELTISMLPLDMIQHFITGLFADQIFSLGDTISQVPLKVASVEAMQEPEFNNRMSFATISPLLVSFKEPEEKYARYLSPDHPQYGSLFFKNLKEKRQAFDNSWPAEDEKTCVFRLLSEPKMKGILIKTGTPEQTKVIGYKYDFELTASADLIRFGYYTGFGEKNSMGFGCVDLQTRRPGL
jgi:CRISPR-associated endoribonuclease Cas6